MFILHQERLNYDNEVTALENAIRVRKKNLGELNTMYETAEDAREMAKVNRLYTYLG